MAKKQSKNQAIKPAAETKPRINLPQEPVKKPSFKLEIASMPWLNPYIPGILLFIITLIIALITYKDYGVSWDEPAQRAPAVLSYNYIFFNDHELFNTPNDNHGAGFELLLIFFEKWLSYTDTRDIYLMRHIVSHIFFLLSVFAGYVLALKLFKNKFIASLAFIMLAFTPRLYAHSFFNTKDLPFLAMFIITLTFCQIAFEKNKPGLFFLLGMLCGYTTSIRIMGIMLGGFILMFLILDFVFNLINKKETNKIVMNTLLFSVGFCFLLYIAWPYLWKDPVGNFIESFNRLAHFDIFVFYNLVDGKFIEASKLPWTYFPTWFLISNPEVWLLAGIAGIILVVFGFCKSPISYIKNTDKRNYLLFFLCFITPVVAVIGLKSVIYDDWRHLYFVYPSFVFLGLFFIDMLIQTKYHLIVKGLCIVQVALVGVFMFQNHPFHQVYFNNLVPHSQEYLRTHYDLEYWGCAYKQGIDFLIKNDNSNLIKVYSELPPLVDNNIMFLDEKERNRIIYAEKKDADYFITNYRIHPYDYPSYKSVYSISVLNSTILSVFKLEKDTAKVRQYFAEEIGIFNKYFRANPEDFTIHWKLFSAYYTNEKYDSAESYGKWIFDHNHNDSSIIKCLAITYFKLKKYPQAIEMYRRASQIYPMNASTYSDIGACHFISGNYDSAIHYWHCAISVDHNNQKSFEYLALLYKIKGIADSARKYEALTQKK